jgi:glycogen operon protein
LAAACVSTHDLPTLAGWWNGTDIAERQGLGLLDHEGAEQAAAARADEKTALVIQLREEGLLGEDVDIRRPAPDAVASAIHALLSSTPALLALVQADDLAGEIEAVNLPGTDQERPNWRRRLDVEVETLCRTPLAVAILAALKGRSGA